jgi:hypothetical protein
MKKTSVTFCDPSVIKSSVFWFIHIAVNETCFAVDNLDCSIDSDLCQARICTTSNTCHHAFLMRCSTHTLESLRGFSPTKPLLLWGMLVFRLRRKTNTPHGKAVARSSVRFCRAQAAHNTGDTC